MTASASLPSTPPTWLRYCLIAGFFPLVALVLGLDSTAFASMDGVALGVGGQAIADGLAGLFFLVLLLGLDAKERVMALIFVPFSALAEYLFSPIWEVYIYRLEHVPLYVPLGHAILFSTGLMISKLKRVDNLAYFQVVLLGTIALLFSGSILLLHDAFSAILGLLFALVLWWRSCRLVYPIMCFLVLYIELLGTGLGCWTWEPEAFDALPTTNPPFGAFVFYVFGDIAVLRMTRSLRPLANRLGISSE